MANVLAVGAHPDDVEFGCAGTLIKHLKNLDNVTILHMTNTGYKDLISGEILRTQEQSVYEARAAAEIIGANMVQLSFEEQMVPFNRDSIVAIEKYIVELKINTIYTHWSGDSHQDHINTLKSVLAAARYIDNIFLYEQVPLPRVGYINAEPNYYVDISEFFDLKIETALAHKSQVEDKYKDNILSGLRSLAEFRGSQCNCKYAEAFESIKQIIR